MIEYIEVQLCAWGRWALRQDSGALGYPKTSPMFREYRSGGAYSSSVPFGVQDYVDDTDAAIKRCSLDQRKLAAQMYMVGGAAGDVASRLGISRRTLYRRLDVLHLVVMDRLHDIEIERQDFAAATKAAVAAARPAVAMLTP